MTILRYFNPAGAHPSGLLGEDPRGPPANLFPSVAAACSGTGPGLRLLGNDWDTRDGSGERDFVHVVDLARGHLAAVARSQPGCRVFNLGTGRGSTVLEVSRKILQDTQNKKNLQ